MKVLTFGELMLRLSAPGYTRLFQHDSLDTLFCGSEANVAVSLAQFGVESKFVTKLPDSDVGTAAARSLAYFGVDTSGIKFGDGRMGIYYLEKGASQRPSKVIYDRAYSAVSLAKQDDFDWDGLFADVDWFHWSGITPALSSGVADITLEACKAAKARGVTVSCDLNYRKKLWDTGTAFRVMTGLMPYADVCVANEEDAEKVLGIKAEHSDVEHGSLKADDYYSVARQISDSYGCKYVGVTLRESHSASRNGWSGLLFSASEDRVFQSTKYEIDLVDRVGGGDSFTAGLIYSLLKGTENQDALEFAVAASCLKQTIEGDFNRALESEVLNLVGGKCSGRVQR